MKIIFILLLTVVIFTSCCIGNRKCEQDFNSARFRIVSSTGQDLIFGPTKIYDKNLLKFYSVSGTDTILHHYGPGPNPNPGQDSLLFVDFDYRKKETVYVLLTNSDVDTLTLTYQLVNASPCCQDYYSVNPIKYNDIPIQTIAGGITIIHK